MARPKSDRSRLNQQISARSQNSHVSRHNSHAGFASRGNSRHGGGHRLTDRDLSLVGGGLSDQELLRKDPNQMTEEEFIRYQQLQSDTLNKRPVSMRNSLPNRPAMAKDSFHDDEHRYS